HMRKTSTTPKGTATELQHNKKPSPGKAQSKKAISQQRVPPTIVTVKVVKKEWYHEAVFRVPGSRTALNPSGTWKPIKQKLLEMVDAADLQLEKEAQAFTGHKVQNCYEAEKAIDHEVERRIVAKRIRNTEPINSRFWLLPLKCQIEIWKGVMNIADRVQPYAYLGTCGGYGFFLPEAWAPTPTALRSVDKAPWPASGKLSLRDATCEALYSHTTFAFTLPERLHRFLDSLTAECLSRVRKVEIHFETDVGLAYVRKFLGFEYGRMTPFMRGVLDDKHIEVLFEQLTLGCKKIELTIVFPNADRMSYAGAEDGCHLTLCKWMAKAIGACAARYPKVKVLLKSYCPKEGTDDLCDEEMEMLRALFEDPYATPWWKLCIHDQSEVVYG
ncbi:MAG: hypothetical protein ACRYGR_01980, partial [Janthinobacterium lividum]